MYNHHSSSWCLSTFRASPGIFRAMACCMSGAQSLFEPSLAYFQVDPNDIFQWNYISSRICIWKCLLRNGGCFVQASICNTWTNSWWFSIIWERPNHDINLCSNHFSWLRYLIRMSNSDFHLSETRLQTRTKQQLRHGLMKFVLLPGKS